MWCILRSVDSERREIGQRESERPPREPRQSRESKEGPDLAELRDYVPADIRDVSFPAAVRGYERSAVDAYVQRVNTVIAELEVSRSPQAAVKHALDRVGRQTSGILQQARETADEISASAWAEADRTTARAHEKAEEMNTRASAEAEEAIAQAKAEAAETTTRAKAEADDVLARSRAEAAERLQRLEQEIATLQEQSETKLRKLEADTETVWREHDELVEDLREMGSRLQAVATEATARFPGRAPSGSQDAGTEDTAALPPRDLDKPEPSGSE